MLIRFTVSNFMSFKDETEFNMLPASGNGSRKLKNHIHTTDSGVEVLRTAAIYGANAAGKSNLVKAIDYFRDIIVGYENVLVSPNQRFRIDTSYRNKPTTFRIEYEYQKIHFDYAIEIHKGKIKDEWLYLINSVTKQQETLLYTRQNNVVELGEYFNSSSDLSYMKKYLSKELQETQTVLQACFGNFEDNDILDIVFAAFQKLHIVMPDYKSTYYSQSILTGRKSFEFAKGILINSKTGIEDLIINEIDVNIYFSYADENFKRELIDDLESLIETIHEDENKTLKIEDLFIPFQYKSQISILRKKESLYFVSFLKTKHFNSEYLFEFDEESDGTNRLFELSPAFEELVLEGNVVYIIDELERSMHPLLAKELLRMYALSNAQNCQLIFTTHESHLLDNELLRRDEIWFTEKRDDGSTEFYPLSNFNPRGDKVLERGYLEGRYGGIPFLGDFSKILVEENIE